MHGIIRNRVVITGLVIFFFCLAPAAGWLIGTPNAPAIQGTIRSANSTGNSDKSGDEWPMFRGGLCNNGTTTTTAESSTSPFWTYTGSTSVFSGVVIAGGRVYAPTANSMYCFDATTGALIWQNLTGVGGIDGSAAVAGGYVYVGVTSTNDRLYCLNATTGWEVWNYTFVSSGGMHSSPAVSGGHVYVGSNGDGLKMLNAATGALEHTYNIGSVQGAPAVVGGSVYVASSNYISRLNAADLSEVWKVAVCRPGLYLYCTPTVYMSYVYVSVGRLLCLFTSNGAVHWNATIPYTCGYGSPAVAGGYVYIGTEYGAGVYCFSASTGAIVWNAPITGYQWSTPAISQAAVIGTPEKLYIGSSNKVFYCLNAMTGASIWTYTTGGRITCSPAIANGRVYFGSEDFKVYSMPMTLTTTTNPPPDIPGSPLLFVVGVMILAIAGIVVRARRMHYLAKTP
jgi:outer membrane protein assembly factor BamB